MYYTIQILTVSERSRKVKLKKAKGENSEHYKNAVKIVKMQSKAGKAASTRGELPCRVFRLQIASCSSSKRVSPSLALQDASRDASAWTAVRAAARREFTYYVIWFLGIRTCTPVTYPAHSVSQEVFYSWKVGLPIYIRLQPILIITHFRLALSMCTYMCQPC